jgi:hypothetical protein
MKEKLVKMKVYPSYFTAENCSEIILYESHLALPIYISTWQAESIMNGMQGRKSHRPFTHDLFIDVINCLGASIQKVVIDDMSEGIFLAKLYVEHERNGRREEVVMDARPSDCIALAVREGCPIYVAEEVLKKAGRNKGEMGIENL